MTNELPPFGALVKLARDNGYSGPSKSFTIDPQVLDRLTAEQEVTVTESTPEPFPLPVPARDLHKTTNPAPSFLIDGIVLAGHVNLASGVGGVGKSLLAKQAGLSVSTGKALFGRQVSQMPVLSVNYEDDLGTERKRLEAACAELDTQLETAPIDFWCLAGHDAPLAYVEDNGDWRRGPFLPHLEARLAAYEQPIFLILDNVADVAVLDETKRGAVNAFIKKVLGRLCERYGATILLITHPSKAALADGSGYAGTTAWNNAVRQRLSLEWPTDAMTGDRRILKIAKSNYGQTGEIELFLFKGVFLTREAQAPAEENARLMDACVVGAIAAAEQGYPIQAQRKPPKWVFDEIEKSAGRRPTRRELLETLNYASRAGRIRYMKGNSKRMAGFYPWDEQRAAEMAAEAKRHAAEVEALSVTAKKREAVHG
ncbi:MAG TPA: AAA family ATPase [Rhizomicrobium sp.]|nr:AAA family ATPase [Rhizomicrobium sp.]